MAAYFFDSSALIKGYVLEPGTTWVRALLDPVNRQQIFVARLSILEVAATLMRQARAGNVPQTSATLAITQIRHAFAHEFRVIELTPLLARHALNLIQNHALRGSDAVHLAAATELQRRRAAEGFPSLRFLSSDSELNIAARGEGLLVEDPNGHS